jgi:hypothetical protein
MNDPELAEMLGRAQRRTAMLTAERARADKAISAFAALPEPLDALTAYSPESFKMRGIAF